MDFYLESPSALRMLTGIFHYVDVYLHHYILAAKLKCKMSKEHLMQHTQCSKPAQVLQLKASQSHFVHVH